MDPNVNFYIVNLIYARSDISFESGKSFTQEVYPNTNISSALYHRALL